MLYTSYYGRQQQLRNHNIKMVAISAVVPSWLPWIDKIKLLAPPYELIQTDNIIKALNGYIKHLENIGIDEINYELKKRWKGDYALLCYEKWDDIQTGKKFCHRRFFAGWYQSKTGIEIPEWTPELALANKKPETQPLYFMEA